MTIIHDHHQQLIRTLQSDLVPITLHPKTNEANCLVFRRMNQASPPDPEASTIGEDEPTSTDDSTDGGVALPTRVSEATSSTASFATVRAWLERIEQESPSASAAKYGAGAPSSPNNTANSMEASLASPRRQERDTYECDDGDEGEDSRCNP